MYMQVEWLMIIWLPWDYGECMFHVHGKLCTYYESIEQSEEMIRLWLLIKLSPWQHISFLVLGGGMFKSLTLSGQRRCCPLFGACSKYVTSGRQNSSLAKEVLWPHWVFAGTRWSQNDKLPLMEKLSTGHQHIRKNSTSPCQLEIFQIQTGPTVLCTFKSKCKQMRLSGCKGITKKA